ncbi:MAG: hypothetical protein KBC11_01285 [Candidatus Pacebacteria bacterium]|nr:hypothetical protein [Candidatus Paceibacterota bacterium]
MPEIQPSKKTDKSRLIGPKLILKWIVSVVIFALILSSVIGLFSKHKKIREQIKELKEEEVSLKQKKQTLSEVNEYIETPEGQEYIFRDKYRLVKPGEGIIVVTKKEEAEPLPTKKPALRRFWDSIKRGLGLK